MTRKTVVTLGSRIAIAGEGLGLFKGKSIVAAITDLSATVTIENHGTGVEVKYGPPFTDTDPSLDSVGAIVRTLQKKRCTLSGVRVAILSNVPIGQGLASSGVLFCAIAQAFNDHFNLGFTKDEIAHIAWEAERFDQGIMCGKFDQLPILYKGVLLQDFSQDPIRILRLNFPADTAVIVGTTGIPSSYGEVGEFIKHKFNIGDAGVNAYRETMKVIVEDFIDASEKNELSRIGQLITTCHDAIRDQLGIKNEVIDELVQVALHYGAYAAKTCGIRFRGGSMFALCPLTEASRVAQALTAKGAIVYITRIAYPSII